MDAASAAAVDEGQVGIDLDGEKSTVANIGQTYRELREDVLREKGGRRR
jgi:hypothetical protein